MLRLRSRTPALALALAVLCLAAAPVAAAAPAAPGAGAWWSSLAAAFDGLFGALGLGGVRSVSAPNGAELEPDGVMITVAPTDPNDDGDTSLKTDEGEEGSGDGGPERDPQRP